MIKKKNIGATLSSLLHNNKFLAIISVVLALFVWIYILYIVNPVNETVFDKVEVNLAYEGSVPDRNGYMYLMTDPNLTVSVTVSGSRSELLSLSKDDIKASLVMDSVISEGTYNVSVSASTSNSNLKVTDVYPKSFTIEFAAESTKEVPVELISSGALPSGYELDAQSVTPQTITVSGPTKTVNTISKAFITVPLTNLKENLSAPYDISLVNEAGENVDRRYLTMSDASVQAALEIRYRKVMEAEVEFTNAFGGNNQQSFIKLELEPKYIKVTGLEKNISLMDKITIGSIDTSTITRSTTTTITIPEFKGLTFDTTQVIVSINIDKDVITKTISFKTDNIIPVNVPEGKTAKVQSGWVSIRVRGKADALKALTASTLRCEVDLSESNADGSYPIFLTPTASVSGVAFDVVGTYGVKVDVQ